jgi:hypothetical protein
MRGCAHLRRTYMLFVSEGCQRKKGSERCVTYVYVSKEIANNFLAVRARILDGFAEIVCVI